MKNFRKFYEEEEIRNTAGIIITNGNLILVGRATNLKINGREKWDIPKGGFDAGEVPIEAAIRETKEETNLTVKTEQLTELGTFRYKEDVGYPDKIINLFQYKVDTLPNLDKIKCNSMFIGQDGKNMPELDKFKYATVDELSNLLKPALAKIIKGILTLNRD